MTRSKNTRTARVALGARLVATAGEERQRLLLLLDLFEGDVLRMRSFARIRPASTPPGAEATPIIESSQCE